jgi:exonuclease SbcC
MLIDEGFGTLDPETLDMAVNTLMELQTHGKMVGIISHVEELKERMDNILEVTAVNERSTTKFK